MILKLSSKKVRKSQHLFAVSIFSLILSMGDSAYALEQKPTLLDIAQKFMQRVQPKLEQTKKKYENIDKKEDYKNPLKRVEDGEELLFSLYKGKLVLSNNVFSVVEDRKIYLSLSEFLYALDFPITFDYDNKTAKGWFISEGNTFDFDINKNRIQLADEQIPLRESDYIIKDKESDIYVKSEVLAKAFGFELTPDIKVLKMEISGGENLPVEAKIARKRRKDELVVFDYNPQHPEIDQGYEAISEPFVDVQLSSNYSDNAKGETESGAGYSIITANDFAYGGFKTYTSGSEEEALSQFRMTWTRTAKENEDLFGTIDKVQLGDITPARMSLFSGSGQEFGMRFDNSALGNSLDENVDSTRFEGDIQPGWDVELYNNNILIDLETAGSDGRYTFEDVGLNFGENNFRLVFYGPQGQVEETTQTILRAGNQLDIGQSTYSLSLTNQNEITYRADTETETSFDDSGTPNLIGAYELGVSDKHSLSLGGRIHTIDGEQNAQVYSGITGYYDLGIINATVGTETDGGAGFQATALTKVNNQNIRFLHKTNTNDFDTSSPNSDNIVMRNEASMQGSLTDSLNYNTALNHYMQDSGANRYTLASGLGTYYGQGSYSLGHTLKYDDSAADTTSQDLLFGTNHNFSPFFVRARANYGIQPEMQLKGLYGSILSKIAPDLSGQFEVEHLVESNLTDFTAKLNYKTDHFTLSPNVSYNTDEDLRAYMTMRFGIGRDPYSGETIVSRDNMTSLGGVSARAFFDENGNGVWDSFEDPVTEADIRAVQSSRGKETDEKGIAFIPNLNEGNKTDIVLSEKSLKDSYWMSMNPGNSVTPRAGKITQIDFPIVSAGEIDGVVNTLDKRGSFVPARRIPIHLVDMNGSVVKTVETAYDGFYVMDKIPPGSYEIKLDEKDLESRGLLPVESKGFILTAKGDSFFDESFLTVSKEIPSETLYSFAEVNTDKGVVLELGRFKSKMMMGLKLLSLRRNYGALIADMDSFSGVLRQDKNMADNKYSLQLGPVKDIDQAINVCNILKQFGEECTIKSVQRKRTRVSSNQSPSEKIY